MFLLLDGGGGYPSRTWVVGVKYQAKFTLPFIPPVEGGIKYLITVSL